MLRDIAGIVIGLGLPYAVGSSLIKAFFKGKSPGRLLSGALSYGLGMGLLAHVMLLIGIAGIPYSVGVIGIPLAVFSALFFLIASRKGALPPTSRGERGGGDLWTSATLSQKIAVIVLSAYIFYYGAYIFWRALHIPVYAWDAVASIAFKAKVFFFERTLGHLRYLPHPSYPLHTSFSLTWIALAIGRWDDQLVKIIFPFAFVSFIIIHTSFLAHYVPRRWALFGSALLVSSNLFVLHATIAYRDFFLLYYICTAIMLLFLWQRTQEGAWLLISSFFAGFASFTKLEGTVYLGIYIALFLVILVRRSIPSLKSAVRALAVCLVPGIGMSLLYHWYKLMAGVPTREKTQLECSLENLSRIPAILKAFGRDLFLSGNWGIVWFILAVSLALNLRRLRKNSEAMLLTAALGMFFGMYFLNALLTTNFVWIAGAKSITTLSRLILHFFPLATVLIVIINYSDESSVSTSSLKPRKHARSR